MLEATVGVDLDRLRADPPVEQIEMMRGFVAEQGAALVAQAVPAPEVGRAVVGVQVPVEVDRRQAADLLFEQMLLEARKNNAVAVIQCHDQLTLRLFGGVEDGLAFRLVCRHRFLRDDIEPGAQAPDDKLVVG